MVCQDLGQVRIYKWCTDIAQVWHFREMRLLKVAFFAIQIVFSETSNIHNQQSSASETSICGSLNY